MSATYEQGKRVQELASGLGCIYTPENFDEMFDAGMLSTNQFSGCTTMSLTRFMEDLWGTGLQSEQWLQVFPREKTRRGLWRVRADVPQVPLKDLIQLNRNYFSWQSGFKEVLYKDYPEAAEIIFAGDYGEVLSLGRLYGEHAPINSIEDLRALINDVNTKDNYVPSQQIVGEAVNLLLRALGSIELVDEMLSKATRRQGVQVIYGGSDFDKYYAEVQKNSSGDVPWGKLVSQRIPARFIIAALPLGEYEREQLGVG